MKEICLESSEVSSLDRFVKNLAKRAVGGLGKLRYSFGYMFRGLVSGAIVFC